MSIDSGNGNGVGGLGVRVSLEAALGQLSQTMGGINETLNQIHKFLTPNPRQSPLVRSFAATAVSDGSVYFMVDLGGPTSGRLWDVRRVATWPGGNTDPFTALVGVTVALVKVSAGTVLGKGSATSPAFLDMGLAPLQCPNDAEFSVHQFTVRFGEHVALLYKGTTNLQALMASGQAEEYIESSGEMVTM